MNQNGGQTIFIRLRPAHDKSTFLPLEDSLVGTLLHEFTHNVHGPHHKQFYEFLDRLQDEYDALRAGGYTGEGFLSEGKRAGTTRDLPTYLAREKALQEAQKRQKIFDIMGPVGGSRLGSSRAPAGKTPKQMAADAAERRARDDKACGHGLNVSDASVEEEMKQATQHSTTLEGASKPDNRAESTHRQSDSDSDIEIIENPMLTAPSAGSSSRASRRKPDSTGSTAPSAKRARRDSISSSGNTRPARLQNSSWICMICTYDNDKALGLACEMCGSERQSAFDPEQLLEPNPKPRIMKNSRVNLPVDSKRMW